MPDPTDPLAAMVERAAIAFVGRPTALHQGEWEALYHEEQAIVIAGAQYLLEAAGVPALLTRLSALEGFVKSVALDGPWPDAGTYRTMAQDLLATLTQEDPDE